MNTYHFQLVADHNQWYLEDVNASPATAASPEFWTPAAMSAALASARDMAAFGTVRTGTVIVSVSVQGAAPEDDVRTWDQVVDAAIETSSGQLVVAGCTEPRESAERINLAPGVYNLRAYYGNLDIDDPDADDGDDFYNVVLWPGSWRERVVVKRYGD